MPARRRAPQGVLEDLAGSPPATGGESAGGDGELRDQPCYEFNDVLPPMSNDRRCRNCRKFLTLSCEQIDRFLDEDGDVGGIEE